MRFEKLLNAYNYTFLNLGSAPQCDFVSARNIDVPQAELEIDMIDRSVLNLKKAKKQIDMLREMICTI